MATINREQYINSYSVDVKNEYDLVQITNSLNLDQPKISDMTVPGNLQHKIVKKQIRYVARKTLLGVIYL